MEELELELKKDYGNESHKTGKRTFSGRISVELPSGNNYECPYCGLRDSDPQRHRGHVEKCREGEKVELISRGAMAV